MILRLPINGWEVGGQCSSSNQVILHGALLNAAAVPADDDDFDPEDDVDFDDFEDEEGSLGLLVDDDSEGVHDVDASGASVNTGQVDWCV